MSDSSDPSELQRLQKLLASAGIASRRVIEEMISQRRISVNGQQASLGMKATVYDEILLDGQPLLLSQSQKTFLLNKPAGVISSASDERGRTTVVDLIECDQRIYPIGRLDSETTGLILISNDGDLTYKLTHPKFGIKKKYVAQLDGVLSREAIETLRSGVKLDDGMTAPAKVRLLAQKDSETLIEITIHEGRNRQIRRMAETIGHPVISLKRIQIGPIADPTLGIGQYRELTVNELHNLYQSATTNGRDPD